MSTSSRPLSLTLIAAVTRKNGLGVNGSLPWKLPKEMAHFRRATSEVGSNGADFSDTSSRPAMNAVLMGRKTWESIPTKFRPLKGRINVVISRSCSKEAEKQLGIAEADHTHLVSSLESAVEVLQKGYPNISRIFLIGGAQLYSQTMQATPKNAVLDRLLITRIYDPVFEDCDVFLPEFRTALQIEQEEGGSEAAASDTTAPEWKRCSEGDFNAFMGDKVELGHIEEKGVRYQLQMWERSS